MTYRIEISRQAQDDIEGIYEYIAFNLLAPDNAAGILEKIEKNILNLKRVPLLGRRYESEPWFSRGLRVVSVGNYVILYIPDSEKELLTVVRVLYGARDIDAELRD